jgi:alanine-glyoxylate transaminase/serine-glyoxylate transaminase/serine-pyruvate transaminase
VAAYYVSWKKWLPIMKSYEARKAQYFATPAVQLIIALNTSLKQILAEKGGMEGRFMQHTEASDKFKDSIEKMGLKLVPVSRAKAAHSMTAIRVPEGLTLPDILPKMLAQKVMIAGGLHPEHATTYFRVGTMGISVTDESQRHYMATTLTALERALKEAGYKFPEANGH